MKEFEIYFISSEDSTNEYTTSDNTKWTQTRAESTSLSKKFPHCPQAKMKENFEFNSSIMYSKLRGKSMGIIPYHFNIPPNYRE